VDVDLRRLIVRHRHVGPMVSALLAGTNARVKIVDADGQVVLDRQTGQDDGSGVRAPIQVEGRVLGWVEGGRVAPAVAAVLSYASARETDKRSLSAEALERYRELNLIYDLAQTIGADLQVEAVSRVALGEIARLPGGGRGFLLLSDGPIDGPADLWPSPEEAGQPIAAARAGEGVVGVIATGEPAIVNDVRASTRATAAEKAFASLVAAPLRLRGTSLGVIGAVNPEPVEYRAADLKVLTAIAALTAPAIDQCRTHARAVATPREPADVATAT
jgi:hypothetical protein